MNMGNSLTLEQFAKRFLTSRMPWWKAPRVEIQIFKDGNNSMFSLILYREGQFQVELLLSPYTCSSFPSHRHPDVDTIEFPITGNHCLIIDGQRQWTEEQMQQWLDGELRSPFVPINHDNWHSGGGKTGYCFLSIQHWLNNIAPTSVGLNWEGEYIGDVHQKLVQLVQKSGT